MARVTINEQVSRVVGLSPGPQGPIGPIGLTGETGPDGDNGVGLPAGGTVGQVPTKQSSTDYDSIWASIPSAVVEVVEGGAGYTNISGVVTMNLSASRVFLHTMTGNVTSLGFSNVPAGATSSAQWLWGLTINATGGYLLGSPPTVTWLGGDSWASLDLTANAVNFVLFFHADGVTYARMLSNGTTELDELHFYFQVAGDTKVVIRTPVTIDVANAQVDGAGTPVYKKGASVITTATAFTTGDVLVVTGALDQSISLPRYL